MHGEDYKRRLALASKKMEHRLNIEHLLVLLADFEHLAANADKSVAKLQKRPHGKRTKLSGGVAVEKQAVNVVRRVKDYLRQYGVPSVGPWESAKTNAARWLESGPITTPPEIALPLATAWWVARERVGAVLGVSAQTLLDWERGVRTRERARSSIKPS